MLVTPRRLWPPKRSERSKMVDDIKAYDGPIVTRAKAREAGLPRYFTGKICPNGHIDERYVANAGCYQCSKAWVINPEARKVRRKAAYVENIDAVKEQSAAWYLENKERKHLRRLVWLQENAESVKAVDLAWKAANPEMVRASGRNRRARKRNAEGSHTKDDIAFLMKVQGSKCAYSWCRKTLKGKKHVDHVVPLVLGGGNGRNNLQLLCPRCNWAKGPKHPIDFAQKHGMLL